MADCPGGASEKQISFCGSGCFKGICFQCFLLVIAFNWINWSCSAKKGSVQLSLFILYYIYICVCVCVDRSAHLVRMSSHIHLHKMHLYMQAYVSSVSLHALVHCRVH